MADYAPSWGACTEIGGYQFSEVIQMYKSPDIKWVCSFLILCALVLIEVQIFETSYCIWLRQNWKPWKPVTHWPYPACHQRSGSLYQKSLTPLWPIVRTSIMLLSCRCHEWQSWKRSHFCILGPKNAMGCQGDRCRSSLSGIGALSGSPGSGLPASLCAWWLRARCNRFITLHNSWWCIQFHNCDGLAIWWALSVFYERLYTYLL